MLDNPGDVTSQLESWTPFNNHTLGLRDLDLSFTVSPERQPRSLGAASASARRPAPRRAQMHSARQPRTDPRPRAQLQPRSILRSRLRAPRFSPINEHPDPDPEAEAEPTSLDLEDLDTELDPAANNTFWTSTPMPPRTLPVPVSANQNTISRPAPAPATTGQKPGYLKTPSKRSVVRERIGTAGTITKTPGAAGVSSFQERLREGGLV
jgi:protein SFI1